MDTIKAVIRSAWAYIRTWIRWAVAWLRSVTWAPKLNGMYVLAGALVLLVLVFAAYWSGKWSGARDYAVSLFMSEPLAPLPKPLPVPDVDDAEMLRIENARLEADVEMLTRQLEEARAVAPQSVSCEPVVKWKRYCPREKTVMEELGF